MSEFDAAIRALGDRPRNCCVECDSIRAAIGLLEAAGRLYKEDLEYCIQTHEQDLNPDPILDFLRVVLATLSALPDKPEGGK